MISNISNAARRERKDRSPTAGATQVLVMGGGITRRRCPQTPLPAGLQVTLVERHGSGPWLHQPVEQQLIHGGLRYLASGNAGVALESARERHLPMTRIAPHLVGLCPPSFPTMAAGPVDPVRRTRGGDVLRAIVGTGRETFFASGPTGRCPYGAADDPCPADRGLRGAIVGWDGQVEDDAQLVVAVARTAAAYGAKVLTHADAVSVGGGRATLRDENGRVPDRLRRNHHLHWRLDQRTQSGDRAASQSRHAPRRALERLGNPITSMTVSIPGEFGRFVFAIPQPDGLS